MNQNEAVPPQAVPAFFFLVVAEVIFNTQAGGIQVLRTQMIDQRPHNAFTLLEVTRLQERAIQQIIAKMPPEEVETFQPLDVFILAITPLGQMDQEVFWARPTHLAAEDAAVSADETASGDTPSATLEA